MTADSATVTARHDPACGPYILWLDYGCEGWKPESFPTLKQALSANRYSSNFVVTKLLDFDVVEK